MKNYPAPSAGSDGNYGAPTPHAAVAAQEPYMAPEGDMTPMGGASTCAFDAMDSAPGWMGTPGDSA